LKNVPVLMFANKQDLEGSLTCEEIIETMEIDQMSDRQWSVNACSALTGDGKFIKFNNNII
jgi:signal recognition particle receptor subunit beta